MLGDSSIAFEPSPPYTQHKNGISERMIRTLNTKARSMLLDGGPPKRFWAEAIATAAYLHKHTPKQQMDGKFGPHSKPCMLLGYVHTTTKIWRIWDLGVSPVAKVLRLNAPRWSSKRTRIPAWLLRTHGRRSLRLTCQWAA